MFLKCQNFNSCNIFSTFCLTVVVHLWWKLSKISAGEWLATEQNTEKHLIRFILLVFQMSLCCASVATALHPCFTRDLTSNFSRSGLLHAKTRVSLKYFVTACSCNVLIISMLHENHLSRNAYIIKALDSFFDVKDQRKLDHINELI